MRRVALPPELFVPAVSIDDREMRFEVHAEYLTGAPLDQKAEGGWVDETSRDRPPVDRQRPPVTCFLNASFHLPWGR